MEFSEYLRELLKKKGIKISALARLTGIERTTLSKVLAGQRMLPYHSLDAIVGQLRLTPLEEKKLRHFYEVQFEEKGIRESREIIDKMFTDLSNLDFSMMAFEERKLLVNIEEYVKERAIFAGDMNVELLLRMVLSEELSQEDARIEMTIPPRYSFLNEELLHRYLSEGIKADVTQIIAFGSSDKAGGELDNLKYFCQVLPFCLLSYQRYHPYYYYDEQEQKHYLDPFPYFLVTSNSVICLSENGQEAMLLRSKDQVSFYHRHFQKLLEKCHDLIRYTVNPAEVLKTYAERTDTDGYYTVMDQPCFGKYYEDAFIEDHIRQNIPYREYISEIAQNRFRVLRDAEKFYTLFTKSGLQRFRDTGTLDDFPEILVRPFSVEVRKTLMNQMAQDIVSGKSVARILEPGSFPEYLSLTTSLQSGVGFFLTQQSMFKDDFFSIHLEEPSLCKAFHGWLLGLAESRHVLSAENTVKVIQDMAKE